MGSINPENILGKRIVNYLKNEALIGRIGKQKIQVYFKAIQTVIKLLLLFDLVRYNESPQNIDNVDLNFSDNV